MSGCRVSKCGVPQGSVLGPLIFILYINDLEEYPTDSRIGLYADDTPLFYRSEFIVDILLTIQDEMKVVGEWLRANKLSLNVAKTKFIIFGSPYRTANLPTINPPPPTKLLFTWGSVLTIAPSNYAFRGNDCPMRTSSVKASPIQSCLKRTLCGSSTSWSHLELSSAHFRAEHAQSGTDGRETFH